MFKRFLFINILERFRLFLIKVSRFFFTKEINLIKSKKKFIFNTQYIWAFSELEFFSASQLKSQGHEVYMVICDYLPYSEREIISNQNVLSYKLCSQRNAKIL